MLAQVASSWRQSLRNAVAGPSRLGAAPLASTSQAMAAATSLSASPYASRSFHVSTPADACHGRPKLKTHQGAAKRFRPAAVKRVVVDHKSHPNRRLPLMLQAMAIKRRDEMAAAAALGQPAANESAAAQDDAIDQAGLAASAGLTSGMQQLEPKTPADRKALRALEQGVLPTRVIGRAWKSKHMGKQHLNSKMGSHRRTRLRQIKVWGSGQVNKTLQRLIGGHY